MEWQPDPNSDPIDAVIMNPPFSKGQDMAHVSRALEFLRPGGTLVAIMPPTWRTSGRNAAAAFIGKISDHSYDWIDLPEGSFREADTSVNTGILTIHKGAF